MLEKGSSVEILHVHFSSHENCPRCPKFAWDYSFSFVQRRLAQMRTKTPEVWRRKLDLNVTPPPTDWFCIQIGSKVIRFITKCPQSVTFKGWRQAVKCIRTGIRLLASCWTHDHHAKSAQFLLLEVWLWAECESRSEMSEKFCPHSL